ncbi:MAG: YHS domain protein [Thermodesulfovibrio sp.]|nr:YHS domain protein [Thermodesulfovibrio sp.]
MILLRLTDTFLISFSFSFLLAAGVGVITAGKSLADDIAIKGYDPVAYFKAGKAITGTASFTFPWHNMTWHFQSIENRELFAASPEKYAPQYDGYCAWALTEERKAVTDPEVWTIVNGKLYLNCSKAAYEKWSRDIPGNIKKADTNWLKLIGGN